MKQALSFVDDPKFKEKCFITGTFYGTTLFSQRIASILKIHSGIPFPIQTIVGANLAVGSILLSFYFTTQIKKEFPNIFSTPSSILSFFQTQKELTLLQKTAMTSTIFLLLEQRSFRTLIPSSVISLGVHANLFQMKFRSIPTSSPVATSSERVRIQELGKRFGCHQCGSRQLLTSQTFIADHMPPTKIANDDYSYSWWRKLLKKKIPQRLWPQCRNCFSLQGQAVKIKDHVPIFFSQLRLCHFSPALFLLLMESETLRKKVIWVADESEKILKTFR